MKTILGIGSGLGVLFSLAMVLMYCAELLGFHVLNTTQSPVIVFICLILFLVIGAGSAWLTRWAFKPERPAGAPPEDSTSQVRLVLNLAQRSGGDLTVLQVASETGLSIEQSRKVLEDLVTEGAAQMNVDDQGVILYDFPELRSLRPRQQTSDYLPPRDFS